MKPKIYGMKEAMAVGISRITREAEESFVILQRNGADVAMVIPMTLRGLRNMQRLFEVAQANPERLESSPDLLVAVEAMLRGGFRVMEQKIQKDQPEDRATVGIDPSAGLVKGGSRRQKSAAPPSKRSPSSKR